MMQGSVTLGCGYMTASYAICTHNIYLLYPSVACIAFGTGSLYTPPIQTMIDWFPDKYVEPKIIPILGDTVLSYCVGIALLQHE